MTGKVLELENVISPDRMATAIAEKWLDWDSMRQLKKNDWEEISRYLYATDTTTTGNATLIWKNKTTVPKLCQIMDNLYANYLATMFPQRKWLEWEANNKDANAKNKRKAIANYMNWAISQATFKHEIEKCLLDFIQKGNTIGTVEWCDERVSDTEQEQTGYVGPAIRRISPLDIVFNPTAENFGSSPKIIRSFISLGELKELLERESDDSNREEYEELWKYLTEIRAHASKFEGDWIQRDNLYRVDGFGSYREYLRSELVEILTFYGDLFDPDSQKFYKNHVITVVDRHRIIGQKPNPSYFSKAPIFHAAWRKKPDNLWGMGPLDNLVGMQYRMDHVENMKADIFDLVTYPVQKIKGFVEDYTWQPGEKIYVSEEGDVDLVSPDVNALQANFEIQNLERLMEEMAGAPKEAMGFRTPGEKTKYEVQRLENASSRLFQNKVKQFEEQFLEPLLNAMLELARRNMTSATVVKVFDDEFNTVSFQSLTVEDITGAGRIKPVASRHFAEQAELIQNITNLTNSPLWATVQPHFSSIKLAKIIENVFNLEDFEVVIPNIAFAEQADAQRQMQALEEQLAMETETATGIGNDFDLDPMMQQQMQQQMAGPPPTEEPQV